MAEFRVEHENDDGYGRLGILDVPHGPVKTPALFPVINLIGGTTLDSGSVWRHFRDNILDKEHLQGTMFQAMSFLDYNLSPKNLSWWREKSFHERFEGRVNVNSPIFIDSGGFQLMNSDAFGDAPSAGGSANDWGVYTNPDSILKLQADFGGDIIATLDYPIPYDLKEDEKTERMNRSIESAVRCLKLVENPDRIEILSEDDRRSVQRLKGRKEAGKEPGIFVAIHGHDYETIHWYVSNFLQRVEEEEVSQRFNGFAVGSLVPLRSKVDVLVDIVQGAKDAIPEEKEGEIALHVFGVAGKQASLLALLGVDSFDCSSHMQAARFKKYLVPDTWERVVIDDIDDHLVDGKFPCSLEKCPLCRGEMSPSQLKKEINREPSYGADGTTKSHLYGLLARHNFEVYNKEMQRVREAIQEDRLLNYVIDFAREHPQIKKALQYAQVRNAGLERDLEEMDAYDLLVGSDIATNQAKLADFGAGVEKAESRRISLKHTPNSFNILSRDYNPRKDDPGKSILFLIPCSQRKPYSESRTHRVIFDRLEPIRDEIHKVTISGMYGPVPETAEEEDPVLEYEYVLAEQDEDQIKLISDRIIDYLNSFGDQFDTIVAYAVSKSYRQVIEESFEEYGRGEIFPKDPTSLQLTEHFRRENIKEVLDYLNVPYEDMDK